MKPLIKYRGGKSKEIRFILSHIPDYRGRYMEPFFGGGALYFYLEPQQAIINDINAKLMSFYMGVQSDYPALRRELDEVEKIYDTNQKQFNALKQKTPDKRIPNKNEEFYYALRDMFNGIAKRQYSDALLYFFMNKTAYSGMIRYNTKGEFNVPFGRYKHFNTSLITKQHHQLLQNTEIFNNDYTAIFDKATSDDFIFLDPPYDCIFSDYGNEEYKDGFNEESHITLAEQFRKLKCKALLVIGKTSLTEKLYNDWIVDEYKKEYAVNIRNRFKSTANHLLIANYKQFS
ncbi:MAG: Dam family site-specific DNA-(adenine-N6)-methyltransferase [Planctomycetaceae bacterium]|jgi:DNA adenine methylase|nr:Dam family site-specific DNA-(adenine-N6)-methyltransferase [Planctomycetaceae bacterium]